MEWAAERPTRLGPLDLSTRLAKLQFTTFVLIFISNTFNFFATLTPSWQVATDIDANREVESGLWIYCPGTGMNCWYIFSDSLINYYERVDVCRFFLIGDCRKKLLRTPYFFGWHYAVLICMIVAMLLAAIALGGIVVAYFRPAKWRKIGTIVMDTALSLSFITLCIALAVFMINAEMLESKFLIGVKNTFPKSYGYSFYLAGIGMMVMLFALLAAVICSTNTFFMNQGDAGPYPEDFAVQNYVFDARGRPSYNGVKQAAYNVPVGGPQYSPSDASTLQTRTYLSY